uniref:Uncharacterized protein n=1 Tax=Vespula pensylvanica TaxID=30213 RepID=A0A834PA46_VESPE|nr:hypothetical protein H0235_002452 [Vespula pensylvanica]
MKDESAEKEERNPGGHVLRGRRKGEEGWPGKARKYVERVAALLGKVSLLMHLMSEFSSKHHIKDRFDGITRRRRRGRVLNTKLLDLLLPLVWIASLLPQLQQQQQQQQRQYRGICGKARRPLEAASHRANNTCKVQTALLEIGVRQQDKLSRLVDQTFDKNVVRKVRSTAKDSYQRMGDMKVPGPTVMYLETI